MGGVVIVGQNNFRLSIFNAEWRAQNPAERSGPETSGLGTERRQRGAPGFAPLTNAKEHVRRDGGNAE